MPGRARRYRRSVLCPLWWEQSLNDMLGVCATPGQLTSQLEPPPSQDLRITSIINMETTLAPRIQPASPRCPHRMVTCGHFQDHGIRHTSWNTEGCQSGKPEESFSTRRTSSVCRNHMVLRRSSAPNSARLMLVTDLCVRVFQFRNYLTFINCLCSN